jgi:protein SCO1/2
MLKTVFLRNNIWLLCFILFNCQNKENEKESELPYYNTPDFTPIFVSNRNEVNQKITHSITSFSFKNQHGKTITEKDIKGKIHVANFIFTSCGTICPTMTRHMKKVQKEFMNDKNVVMLSYSVTPWIDSIVRLKRYAEDNDITANNWHLLTGSQSEIYTLARKSYFAEEDLGFTKDSTEFLHTEHMILVDRNKHIRGIYNGTLALETEQLIKDMKILLKE